MSGANRIIAGLVSDQGRAAGLGAKSPPRCRLVWLKNVGLGLNCYRADVMASAGGYEGEPNVGEKSGHEQGVTSIAQKLPR